MRLLLVRLFADSVDVESNLLEAIVIEDVASIKDKGRLGHAVIDLLIVIVLELVPLGDDDDGVGAADGLVVCVADNEVVVLGEELLDLVMRDLGVIDVDLGALVEKEADDGNGARLACVSSVLLEGESHHGELLVSHRSVHRLEDAHRESLLLGLVDVNDLVLQPQSQSRQCCCHCRFIKQAKEEKRKEGKYKRP